MNTRRIPLYRRDGSLRAVALVDEEDFTRISGHRWFQGSGGYVRRTVNTRDENGKKHVTGVLLHREILGLAAGDGMKVDHIDHDPLNNTRANLRACTHAENHQNRRACGDRQTSSRYRGVSWDKAKRKWIAYCWANARQNYLGAFDDEDEAGRVAAEFRREHLPYAIN